MTIEEWNQLLPGDLIQEVKEPSIRYMIHALGEDWDCSDDLADPRSIMTRTLWVDPLLDPSDPCYPDFTEYEPGDAERFERVELKAGEPRPALKTTPDFPLDRDGGGPLFWC